MTQSIRQYATFHVADMYFGIEVLQVQELIRFQEITPVPLRHMYGAGVTLRISRVNVRAEMPACVDHVASGHFHPEHVITRKIRFEDAHEASGDPTIRVAFVRDGIE